MQTRKTRTDGLSCNVEVNAATGLPVNRAALRSWDLIGGVAGEEEIYKKFDNEPDVEDKGILCCLSNRITNQDLAVLWENTITKNKNIELSERVSRVVVLASNAVARGVGYMPCDVPLVLFSLFDNALSGGEILEEEFLKKVMPQRKENLGSFSFRDFAFLCMKMAIFLSTRRDGSKIEPVRTQFALASLKSSMGVGKDNEFNRPAIKGGFIELITRIGSTEILDQNQFKATINAKEKKGDIPSYPADAYRELSELSRLTRFWDTDIFRGRTTELDRMVKLMNTFWKSQKLDVVQSRLFLNFSAVMSCIRSNASSAGSGVLSDPKVPRTFAIFLNHIRSLMAFPLNHELEYFDADDVGFLWPFRQMENMIQSAYYKELLIEERSEASLLICRLVVQRWNLICSIIKSSLGPANYREKWEKTSGLEYVKRLSAMLQRARQPVSKEPLDLTFTSPVLLFALSYPREYPLAARPVIEFKIAGSRQIPVLSDTFIFPKVANTFSVNFDKNISARFNTPKFQYFEDAPVADPMTVDKEDLRKYFAYMENTYL